MVHCGKLQGYRSDRTTGRQLERGQMVRVGVNDQARERGAEGVRYGTRARYLLTEQEVRCCNSLIRLKLTRRVCWECVVRCVEASGYPGRIPNVYMGERTPPHGGIRALFGER